jgi:hypothetical protein
MNLLVLVVDDVEVLFRHTSGATSACAGVMVRSVR